MHKRFGDFLAVLLVAGTAALAASNGAAAPDAVEGAATARPGAVGPAVETVVIFRHAEKPKGGLGQISPQGFNRALKLSTVLPEKFGKPDYLFAPDPHERTYDLGEFYSYLRPVATIEPMAIRLGLPVQTQWGYRDIDELVVELSKPQYARAVVFVAWEHVFARYAAAELMQNFGGEAGKVPEWADGDYDSLYVVRIQRTPGGAATVTFEHDHEGLDGQSTEMPVAAK